METLTPRERDICIGTLLGDGSISRNNPTHQARIRCAQGEAQADYLLWKYHELRRWVRTPPRYDPCNSKSGFGGMGSLWFNTVSRPAFTELFELFRPGGAGKCMPMVLFEEGLSDLALAVWIMDDGSSTDGFLTLSTNAFELVEVEAAAHYLTQQGMGCAVHRTRRGPVLAFGRRGSEAAAERARPYVLPSLEYKVNLHELKGKRALPEFDVDPPNTARTCEFCGADCPPQNRRCSDPDCQRRAKLEAMHRWRRKRRLGSGQFADGRNGLERVSQCVRCGGSFTYPFAAGRPRTVCDNCLKPWERKQRE